MLSYSIPRLSLPRITSALKREVADIIVDIVNTRIAVDSNSGNGQRLEPNTTNYKYRKMREGFGDKPLVRTGDMTSKGGWDIRLLHSGVEVRLDGEGQRKWREIQEIAGSRINWYKAYNFGKSDLDKLYLLLNKRFTKSRTLKELGIMIQK